MCYDCFEKHTSQLIDEYSQLQKRFTQLTYLFDEKRQFFGQFQEHCLRSVNAAFDEAVKDLQSLRENSIDYVRHQFNDADVSFSRSNQSKIKPLFLYLDHSLGNVDECSTIDF